MNFFSNAQLAQNALHSKDDFIISCNRYQRTYHSPDDAKLNSFKKQDRGKVVVVDTNPRLTKASQ